MDDNDVMDGWIGKDGERGRRKEEDREREQGS
jgi:hypothetical protein